MTKRTRFGWQSWLSCVLVLVLATAPALAADPPKAGAPNAPKAGIPSAPKATAPAAPEDPDLRQARDLFAQGTDFVQKAQWAEALASFEASYKFRPHAVTTYDIGACQRALGRYTLARKTFARALIESHDHPGQLPETLAADTQGFVAELDRLFVRLHLTLAPASAEIAVDGRPLDVDTSSGESLLVAGTRGSGLPERLPQATATVLLDPGLHVFTLTRKGYSDVVVTRSFTPGSQPTLDLKLDQLPATLHVTANVPGAIVLVDGVDVGPAPIDISRLAGQYTVRVRKPHYIPYEAKIRVNSGEEANIGVRLRDEVVPITKRWWFWTAAVVVIGAAAGGTYLAARSTPAPVRPPLDGGGLGWTVAVP